jgi:ATP-dependent Lon protease
MADLDDLPREVFDELTFVPVDTLDQVLETALTPETRATLDGLLSLPREDEVRV